MLVEKCNLCADVYSTGIGKDIGVSEWLLFNTTSAIILIPSLPVFALTP